MGSRSIVSALRLVVAFGVLTALPGSVQPITAQTRCADGSVRMQTLLEKTIFSVDVLWLTVNLHGEPAERLRTLARERELSDPVADSVAHIAVDATCADARLNFVRGISRDQLLGGIRESTEAAFEAGLIDAETYRFIDEAMPGWYPFLEDRGIEEGDVMTYRIRGDTLNIGYLGYDGEVLLDQTEVGTSRSVLAGYFAPDSDFREGLLRSLFETDEEEETGVKPGGPLP